MIIISQDKMKIYNFNVIFRLYVDDLFNIRVEKSSDNMIDDFLGKYETEERAQEIITEIAQSYLDAENYKYLNERMTTEQLNNMQNGLIYEMPEE